MKKNNKKIPVAAKPRASGGWKLKLFVSLMALVATRGMAMQHEGAVLFIDAQSNQNYYYLDTNSDGLPDYRMQTSPYNIGRLFTILSKYLEQPGTRIIFEDEGIQSNQNFTASRMMGFYMPNGNYVRLDQLASSAEVQRNFPYLWQKMQAEQRGSR
jgi:hypothetical protein